MATQFKEGDKVLYNEDEYTIEVSQKNFKSKKTFYTLVELPGQKIAEEELKSIDSRAIKQGAKNAAKKHAEIQAPEIQKQDEENELEIEIPVKKLTRKK